MIGTYTIDARIGAGGMSEVYRACDAKLDRPVALKLLSRDLAINPERLHRFHAEARAASSLNHPHIVVIHDFGDLDGRPFMVAEYVEGETLRRRLERGPLPVDEAIDVALQIGAALAAAHARGLVHRDIKPENVMRRPDGYVLGLPQASLGRDADAIAAARASAAAVRDPLTRSYQTVLPLVLEGRFAECQRLLDELAPRNPDPESVFHIARTYARIGATESALVQFDRAVDMGFFVYPWFVRDPWLEPLASAARFRDALARAERRHRDAARSFREAEGDRLLSLT